jgi:hypothetical protein
MFCAQQEFLEETSSVVNDTILRLQRAVQDLSSFAEVSEDSLSQEQTILIQDQIEAANRLF